jgi:hypothetical protein
MGCCKTLEKAWFAFTTVLSSITYVVDIISDIILANRYFRKGHRNWGICTTVFIALPWTLMASIGVWSAIKEGISNCEHIVLLVMAVFGMTPVFINIWSLKKLFADSNKAKSNERFVLHLEKYANVFRLVEALLEAVPQIILQMYICGYTNKIDVVLLISILFSLTSVTRIIVNGWMVLVEFFELSPRWLP